MNSWHTTITLTRSIDEDAAFDLLDALLARGAAISFGTRVMVISMTGFGDDADAGARDAVHALKAALPDADVIGAWAQSYEELDNEGLRSTRAT